MRVRAFGVACSIALAGAHVSLAAVAATSKSVPSGGGIEPAAERILLDTSARRGPARGATAAGGESTTAGRPAIRGPKIPEALRAQLQPALDARVQADIAKSKELRAEAIDLLTHFVGETPRGAREMPEALVRLGELVWENERESFVERFEAWDKRPVDQRGTAPELDYRPARELFGRVLHDYPWFEQYDLALYVDGFLAFEQGKEDEARERFERILKDYPQSRFVADAHM